MEQKANSIEKDDSHDSDSWKNISLSQYQDHLKHLDPSKTLSSSSCVYELIKEFGRGGQGSVSLVKRYFKYSSIRKSVDIEVKDPNIILVLKKKLCFTLEEANDALQEAVNMARIQNEYVVKYEDVFLTPTKDASSGENMYYLCIVMEFCEGGDLLNYLLKTIEEKKKGKDILPISLIRDWIFQMVKAVHSFHEFKLTHRDLKSENIFITANQTLKIGDFGLAMVMKEKTNEVSGTRYYMAPEVLQRKDYDNKVDVWSLACILYEMCTLKLFVQTKQCIGEDALKSDFDPQKLADDLPQELSDVKGILVKMLHVDTMKRPSMEVLMREEFFQEYLGRRKFGTQRSKVVEGTHFGDILRKELNLIHIPEAAKLLAKAYVDEPRYIHTLSSDRNSRENILTSLYKLMLEYCVTHGYPVWGLFSKSTLRGVAMWLPPEDKKGSMPKKAVLKFIWAAKGDLAGMKKYIKFYKTAGKAYRAKLKDAHWTLAYCAIDESFREKGLGEFLVQPTLEWADVNEQEIIAMSATEKPFNFLMKSGFELFTKLEPEAIGIETPFWIFRRMPRK